MMLRGCSWYLTHRKFSSNAAKVPPSRFSRLIKSIQDESPSTKPTSHRITTKKDNQKKKSRPKIRNPTANTGENPLTKSHSKVISSQSVIDILKNTPAPTPKALNVYTRPRGVDLVNSLDTSSKSLSNIEKSKFKSRGSVRKKRRSPVKTVIREVEIPVECTVEELASRMALKVAKLTRVFHRDLGEKGYKPSTVVSQEIAELAVVAMKMQPILIPPEYQDLEPTPLPPDTSFFPKRAPIISVMGHVDHGKTTLLDALRRTNLAKSEAGGITQSIGAFDVDMGVEEIDQGFRYSTFIDTPGHAAFSSMRENGTAVTDIIILVLSAEDGVMPQTEEVIKLARASNVPLIVAITKCDRHSESKDTLLRRIGTQLMTHGVVPEDMGGDVQVVCVSGKTGEGLPDLKQAIVLQAEIMDIRSDAAPRGEAVVLDSRIAKGAGVQVDAICTWGTLKVGDYVVSGMEYGKIRGLMNSSGAKIKKALPAMPVRILGLKGLPAAGESILPVKNESEARSVVEKREVHKEWLASVNAPTNNNPRPDYWCKARIRTVTNRQKVRLHNERMRLKREAEKRQSMLKPGQEGFMRKIVPVIIKTDTDGVIAAIESMTSALQHPEVQLKIVRSAVGPINDSDLSLAETTGASVLAFNVPSTSTIDRNAKRMDIAVHKHQVIYSLMEDLEDLLSANLARRQEITVYGAAEILQAIPINTRGRRTINIAGCRVTKGTMKMDSSYRILRNGKVITDGLSPTSMRHFKRKVSEVNQGQECGIQLLDFDEFSDGDVLESYKVVEIKRSLNEN